MNAKPGRPRKEAVERKDVDLRIPVTLAQKNRIMEAVSLEGMDMASWARPVLLKAAEDQLRKKAK
jgi:hypothetical protein